MREVVVQTAVIDQIGTGGGENTMMITEDLLQRGVGERMRGRGRGVGIGTETEEVRRIMMMHLHLVEMIVVREGVMITMIAGKHPMPLSLLSSILPLTEAQSTRQISSQALSFLR